MFKVMDGFLRMWKTKIILRLRLAIQCTCIFLSQYVTWHYRKRTTSNKAVILSYAFLIPNMQRFIFLKTVLTTFHLNLVFFFFLFFLKFFFVFLSVFWRKPISKLANVNFIHFFKTLNKWSDLWPLTHTLELYVQPYLRITVKVVIFAHLIFHASAIFYIFACF